MARRRGSKKYVAWRNMVYHRDMYTCQACQRSNVYLNAHHIEPWSKKRQLRYDVSNGITLCGSCHQQLHEKYGVSVNEKVLWYFILKVPKTLKPPTGKYGQKNLSKKQITKR
jgi:5-methylcytosine-specific restriction endonuclease McrA